MIELLELKFSRRWQTNKIESDWSNWPRHSSSRQFRSPRYHLLFWNCRCTKKCQTKVKQWKSKNKKLKNKSYIRIIKSRKVIDDIIRWHSISMRAGPAFLQFDWSKAGLSMDLPVFVYSHTKTSFRFLQDRENIGKLFTWLQTFYFKQRRGNLTGLLFCLDFVCQGLLITKIVICIHYLIVSSPHPVRPTTLSFAWV